MEDIELTDAQIEAMADKCPGITRHSYILGAKDARAALSTSPAPTQATQDAEQAAIPSVQPAPVPALAPLTGRTHELKTDAHVFSEVTAGRKLFEIRKNDRDFRCGDLLRLRSTRCTGAEMAAGQPLIYTGEEITVRVIGILRGPVYGLAEGWVIMSIAAPAATQAQAEPALYISGPYHDGSMSVCELATGRILHKFRLDGPSAPVGDGPEQPAPTDLHHFYGVTTDAELIAAQAHHIEKLQAKLPRLDFPPVTRVREG